MERNITAQVYSDLLKFCLCLFIYLMLPQRVNKRVTLKPSKHYNVCDLSFSYCGLIIWIFKTVQEFGCLFELEKQYSRFTGTFEVSSVRSNNWPLMYSSDLIKWTPKEKSAFLKPQISESIRFRKKL